MKKWIGFTLVLTVLLTACVPGVDEKPEGLVTVYKLPT